MHILWHGALIYPRLGCIYRCHGAFILTPSMHFKCSNVSLRSTLCSRRAASQQAAATISLPCAAAAAGTTLLAILLDPPPPPPPPPLLGLLLHLLLLPQPSLIQLLVPTAATSAAYKLAAINAWPCVSHHCAVGASVCALATLYTAPHRQPLLLRRGMACSSRGQKRGGEGGGGEGHAGQRLLLRLALPFNLCTHYPIQPFTPSPMHPLITPLHPALSHHPP